MQIITTRVRYSRQRGVVLILTLFVILITFALVTQLTIGTSVAAQTTRNSANLIRMRTSGLAAAEQFLDLLRDDMAGGVGLEGMSTGDMSEGPGGGFGTFGDTPPDDTLGEGEEEGDGEDTDSWEDQWARPMRLQMGDIVVTAWAQDENSKFNLLWMVSEDEEIREQARDRCARIIDRLRHDFDDDLTYSDGTRLSERIARWLEADNRDLDYPLPLRHSDSEEVRQSLMLFPEELMVLEGINQKLYFDQMVELAGEVWIANGLESVFTVWTSMGFDPPETDQSEFDPDSESGGDAAGLLGSFGGGEFAALDGEGGDFGDDGGVNPGLESTGAEIPVQGGLTGAATADSGVGTLINLNTAPRAVLEGLMDPYDMSAYVIGAILEYRNEVDEVVLSERDSEEIDSDMLELEMALYGDQERDPLKFFSSLADLEEIDEFAALDQETKDKFTALLGVQSDVFSVMLDIRIPPADWRPEERYEEPRGPVLRLRGVFWRRNGENGVSLVPIMPWHEVPYSRWRQPDFQDRLEIWYPPEF